MQEILQALSIDYLEQRIDQCSSGQEQKAGIACILLSNADMIIMDEPFVAIDAKSSECLCELIRRKSQDTVFLITSHTAAGIVPIADRLLVLDGHRLILDTKNHMEITQFFQLEEASAYFTQQEMAVSGSLGAAFVYLLQRYTVLQCYSRR